MVEKLVTVFGGSGFVGRHVVRALAKSGYRIRVAVRYPAQAYFLQPLGDVGQIAILKCDICNEQQVLPLVVNADAVVNLVGILQPGGGQNFDDVVFLVQVGLVDAVEFLVADAGLVEECLADKVNVVLDLVQPIPQLF